MAMFDPVSSVEDAIKAVERLRGRIRLGDSIQVRSSEELSLVKATAMAWFNSHRPVVTNLKRGESLASVDEEFRQLLEFAGRATKRERYQRQFRNLRRALVELRSQVIDPTNFISEGGVGEQPPDFSRLVPDPKMQAILTRRWEETKICLNSGAHLAATVMMGALLEALLLARINQTADLKDVFTAKFAPRDKHSKTLPLTKWTLHNYIEVGHELGWIRQSGKDVGVVLRDYRNYIHPHKELSHGVVLEAEDTTMFWMIFASLADQVINSV